jgi:hypothetical protein
LANQSLQTIRQRAQGRAFAKSEWEKTWGPEGTKTKGLEKAGWKSTAHLGGIEFSDLTNGPRQQAGQNNPFRAKVRLQQRQMEAHAKRILRTIREAVDSKKTGLPLPN